MKIKTEEWCRVVLPNRDLRDVLRSVAEEKKTGSLTIHFGQGGVTSIEWQQRTVVLGQWPFKFVPLNGE